MELNHPKLKGEASEAVIIAELKKRGISVLTPTGDSLRYDIAVDIGDILRVQCKTGKLDGDVVRFPTCSSANHTENGEKESYHGDVDYIAVYQPDIDSVYFVPIEETGTSAMTLRISGNGAKNSNWASDYTIERFISKHD